MPNRLPERPNLEQLKNQAKSLLRAARARDAAALRRFAVLPALSQQASRRVAARPRSPCTTRSRSSRASTASPSWKALRDEVEARTLTFDAAVEEFVRCATGGAIRPRRAAARAASRDRDGVAAHRARARGRRRRGRAAAGASGARHTAWRTAELGAAALRLPHLPARARPGAAGRTGRDCAAALRAGCQPERRVPLELASGAAAHRALGRAVRRRAPATRRGAARRGRQSHRRRVSRTSLAAVATSRRSSCCTGTASTSMASPAACRRLST